MGKRTRSIVVKLPEKAYQAVRFYAEMNDLPVSRAAARLIGQGFYEPHHRTELRKIIAQVAHSAGGQQ